MRRGDVVAGRYRLVRELGSGSQGRVWEGLHLQMGTPLAVKVLDPHLANRPDYVSRFKREASAAAALRSPHVVQIFDFGIAQEIPYITMELLEGEDLGARLDRNGRLPPPTVSAIVTQVSRALVRAHKRGIVHRDMKPDNIFLCTDEEGETEVVKILDFGVAKAVGNTSLAKTGTGVVLGTPYYMSPEQAQGESMIDHRTDLWALGVITFEAIVGRRPFEAANLGDLLVKICARPPPLPSTLHSDVPEGFDEWFMRACAQSQDDRFSSAKEMAATLAILCGSVPAALSDPSYVALFKPSDVSKARTSRSCPEPLPSIIGEDDPTQVMTELPEVLRNEVEEKVANSPVPQVPPPPEPPRRPPEPVAPSTEKPKAHSHTQPVRKEPSFTPPILNPRPRVRRQPMPYEENVDDAVEMFDAANVAADMERLKREQQLEEVRRRRREFIERYWWPIAGVIIVLIAVITAALTMVVR